MRIHVFVGLTVLLILLPQFVRAEQLQTAKGQACFTYGDKETPLQAKEEAIVLARKNAVENHRVFIDSKTAVRDFVLEKDLVEAVSRGTLTQVQILNQTQEGRTICVTVSGLIDPTETQKVIDQRVKAKAMVTDALSQEASPRSAFGLKVWVNSSDGRYTEGEELIIHLQSESEGYLQLDYYQADGNVVHLVPNLFRGQAKIEKGETYTFGGAMSAEQIIIQGPFGDELIKAFVSPQPIPEIYEAKQLVEDSASHIQTMKMKLRGVRVQANAAVKLHTAQRPR